jgi:flagellar FliJ protein
MPRRFPLQSLLGLAQSQSDDAAKRLHALRARWLEAEEKLRQLMGYQEDYRMRLLESSRQGLSVSSWRDYQLFLDKLQLAIRQQQAEVLQCKGRWEAGQREWLAEQRKLKAYGTLAQRHERSEERREAQQEQRELDEFAAKIFEDIQKSGDY